MVPPEQRSSAQRPVDARALQRLVARLHAAAQAPWLHAEVAKRMAGRLAVIRLQPAVVLDWWSHLGASREVLARAYPKARIVAVEPDSFDFAAAAQSRRAPWWSPRRWGGGDEPALSEAAATGIQAQLLWANMGLHFNLDVPALMARWRRSAAVDGFLMFSTLGPGSLAELNALYREQGWPPPLAPFVDMHDLGDMLVQAGFCDPVMDQEQITLSWSSAGALLAELRTLGANLDPRRVAGLRTPRWLARLERGLDATRGADGRHRLAFEVVYGHAFVPPPRHPLAPSTSVPLEDMRSMVRSGRRLR